MARALRSTHDQDLSKGDATNRTYRAVNPIIENNSIQEYCNSIAQQAANYRDEMSSKLTNVLALVDITVHLENNCDLQRKKRFAFLAGFIFTTGIKVIWGLFGFVEKIKLHRQLGRIEKSLTLNEQNIAANREAIHNMSDIVYASSFAIEHLKITTAS